MARSFPAFCVLFRSSVSSGGLHAACLRPMEHLAVAASKIADGDLEVAVEATDRQDEIGRMARCIEVFKDNSVERERLASERKVGHIAREKREKLIDSLIADFRAESQSVLELVETNISRVEAVSSSLNERSASASEQGQTAVSTSENASSRTCRRWRRRQKNSTLQFRKSRGRSRPRLRSSNRRRQRRKLQFQDLGACGSRQQDRRRCLADLRNRRTDQSACAERNDRGGTRR